MTEVEELRKWYEEQLARRDKEIEQLRRANQALLRSAIKQAELKLNDSEPRR